MDLDKLVDNLLDSYGVLEEKHDRVCSAIVPEKLDQRKFNDLLVAISSYQKAVEAFRDAYILPRDLGADLSIGKRPSPGSYRNLQPI